MLVLDAETEAKRAELIGPGSTSVNAASFSPDGTRVATIGQGRLHLWESSTGVHLTAFAGRVDDSSCARDSPDGTRLLTRSSGRHYTKELERSKLRLWDVTAGRSVRTLAAPCNEGGFGPELTSFTPDGALSRCSNPREPVGDLGPRIR